MDCFGSILAPMSMYCLVELAHTMLKAAHLMSMSGMEGWLASSGWVKGRDVFAAYMVSRLSTWHLSDRLSTLSRMTVHSSVADTFGICATEGNEHAERASCFGRHHRRFGSAETRGASLLAVSARSSCRSDLCRSRHAILINAAHKTCQPRSVRQQSLCLPSGGRSSGRGSGGGRPP